MIKREELNEMSQPEFQALMEEDLQRYAAELESLDKDEILSREQELIVLMSDAEENLKNVKYNLPTEATFDGQLFSKKVLCEYIVDFVNTQEVEWSYSLGLLELVKLWKNKDLESVSYHVYDSTLRILGQCRYRGYDAWRKILAVNEFLGGCHEAYVRDASYTIYLASIHNELIKALEEPQDQADQAVE